ncbi:MAG: SIR2 family protein [Desulfocapsaceae bacterium]|nr:SIR2 family protein [Desulfocapsaceae bacterium]
MRFFKDGPSIPDSLLIARDEGRVVFFCGAGVSRARAGLLDFFGLADAVICKLGVPADNPACKILHEAREIHKRTGISGLISADRIFGLLERDFLVCDIEAAVADTLQPPEAVDLTAHQILLDLATTPEGKVRLVTTNFDRLFENCCTTLKIWQPPRLPDPSRQSEMDGIIHLHGYANKDYNGAEGDGFILSSSEFGRAYLSDGWATQFFREIIARYVVVFVGYTADDPPVHYLLEALNKKAGKLDGVYAFQSGVSDEATSKWLHKGVEAIPYTINDEHRILWETLSAWAERAKASDEWYKSVIDQAKKGPEELQPHERGQVAHIISTIEGARKFSEGDDPPPAEWLCVFDPYRRYAKPGYTGGLYKQGPFVDPFELYGLDSDIVPKQIKPDDFSNKREVPSTAWDGFAANRLDRQNLRDDSFSAIRGHWATNVPKLPSRLSEIGTWIMKVADQPASVWWAASQFGLHPEIQERIQWQLESSQKDVGAVIRQAWQYLFEAWEKNGVDSHQNWYELKAAINKDGWNSAAIRKFAAINRPYLTVDRNCRGGSKPPQVEKDIRIQNMLGLNVEYPEPIDDGNVPDEWLTFTIRELRKNLELTLQLETELGGYGLNNISPIIHDDAPDGDRYGSTHGLSGSVILFSSLFERLIKFDITSAKQELKSWIVNDDTIFSRLRIWASGKSELVSAQDFGPVIAELSDVAFWGSYHQRDLLLVIAKRWHDLLEQTREEIENRLLQGRTKRDGEDDTKFEEYKAWSTLNRLHWLANKGCNFTFDLNIETIKLQNFATEWKPEYAEKAADSFEGRVFSIKTDTEHSALLNEPLETILAKARELSGKSDGFGSHVKNDPFAGLSEEHPVRAFSALTVAAKRDEYLEWAWHTFLNAEARKSDKAKFSALIAERISRYPNDAVAEFVRPASDWILNISQHLSSSYPQLFDKVISKLINALRSQPKGSNSAIVRGDKEPDWTMEAINAPVGKIAQALFNDPRKNDLEVGGGFPADWLLSVDNLLSLHGDLHRHALVIFARNINWFYSIDPIWTEANMLSILDKDDEPDRLAIWSGFFWGAMTPHPKLYIRMKQNLLAFAKQRSLPCHRYDEVLVGLILAGWGSTHKETGERYISNAEMHNVLLHTDDEFRSHILWQIERWSKTEENAAGEKWSVKLPELLRDVWPRQKSAKTPKISARLCDLAFSNVKQFPEIAEIVLPLLTIIDRDRLMLPNLRKSKDNIVDLYPQQTLALLYAILPDNVITWPYGIEATLHRIGEADESLRSDERLLELNRKWNSR